jgi:mono/diheme cytochrome c family protein
MSSRIEDFRAHHVNKLIAVSIFAFITGLVIFAAIAASGRLALAAAARAYYSNAQAEQGKAEYEKNCARCHLTNLKGKCDGENVEAAGEYVCAGHGNAPPLLGKSFLKRWYSVGDLYSRINGSMPADSKNSLSSAKNLAILAYVLRANGLPAGSAALRPDVGAMKQMVLGTEGPVASAKDTASNPLNSVGISTAYYTERQAERGRAYFQATCGVCHTTQATNVADGKMAAGGAYVVMDDASGRGWDWGTQHRLQLLTGDKTFLGASSGISSRPQRWDTVADLFNKVRTTQPPDYIDGLSKQEYVDIVAYLIQQNGFLSGKDELKYDLNQMRNMTLEKGFERLFNGKDLTGWGFVVGTNCSPRPEGCAQTVPGSTFRVENGLIYDTGTPHGYMYPLRQYGPNFILRVEYRYDPWPGMEDDRDFFGNSGYLLFITNHHVWPRTLEIQGRAGMEMTINAMDGHATFTFDDDLRQKVRKPAGQWNSVEIVSKGNEVWNYLNGTLLSHVSAHDFPASGYIGFQSESATMHYRNIRIKPD